jgi:hypothetical protein
MLHTIEDTPNLAIHRYPSASLYSVVRQNLLALDQATRIGRSAYAGGQGHPQENAGVNPFRKSWGAFRYLPGLTTLTWVMQNFNRLSGTVVRLYVNGALVQTTTLTDGTQTINYTLSGSFAVNSVVEVRWDLYNPALTSPGLIDGESWGGPYEIIDAYVSPVTLSDAWPGVPTFGTTYSTAGLTQLSNAVDWLIRRVGRRTDPLFTGIVRRPGPYGPAGDQTQGLENVRWYGSVITTASAPTLKAMGAVWVKVAGGVEEVRLLVNGSVVTTYTVPTTVGYHTYTLTYAMPQASGTRNYVEVWYRRLSNPSIGGNEVMNEWSVVRVWSEGAAALFAAPSIPTLNPRANMTWATWKAALNACSTLANTLKTRIDNNPTIWSRQYLYRRSYGYDDYQEKVFEPNFIPAAVPRIGEAVLIRGQGNYIGWGAQVWAEDQDNVGSYALTPTYKEQVNNGDTVDTAMVYLDALSALPPGASYNVRGGTIAYAGEIWKVGSDV